MNTFEVDNNTLCQLMLCINCVYSIWYYNVVLRTWEKETILFWRAHFSVSFF